MKRHGKFLLLILAVMLSALMIVSASGLEIFIIASSDEYESYGTSARYLETIKVMQGYEDGELHLEEPILRYQAALFFARVVTGVTDDTAWGTGASAIYTDVPEYGPVIDMISSMDIIRGYGNGKFGYNDGIRYQDMCAMLVRILGYETEEMVAAYPLSYVFKVEELGLALENVKPADYLNRGQTAQMVYDSLVTEIADTTDEKVLTLEKIVEALVGGNVVNAAKETYLERNFDVSSTMQFEIVATENYKLDSSYDFADEGYFEAELITVADDGFVDYAGEIWTFPIEGAPTADVSEASLIGMCLNVVFDEKNPTPDMLADEECEVIHADIVEGVVYENLGELAYVAFDEDMEKLTLGAKTVKVSDLDYYAYIWQYSDDANAVIDSLTVYELAEAIENNTYFALECYDYNKDGYYDTVIYKPYSFGQYAERTYSGKDYITVGQYYPTAVYDITNTAEKTDDNKTYFVEYFLGQDTTAAAIASKSYAKYTPGDTSLKVSESASELSMNVTVTGEEIKTGDFMLYYYNKLTNKLDVVENLGTYQLGTLTGYKTRNESYILDGSEMSVGVPGNMVAENGLLVGDGAYAETYEMARVIVANYEKGNYNAKYLEYDGKIVYLEPYGGSDVVVGSDWAIIDAEETLEKYLDSLKDEDDAWDVPFEGNVALLEKLDAATGDFETIKVEEVVVVEDGADKSYTFKNIAERHEIGTWKDMQLYKLLSDNGVMYAVEDEDEDGLYEIYAYGTENFNVLGAKAVVADGDEATVSFSYNKSNEFVAENSVGVLTDRVATNANTVSVVIGQDGYTVVKGALGTDSVTPNGLWLSDAALILEANDNQITIFDPVGYIDVAAASNHLYDNNEDSIWHTGDGARNDEGIAYYMMLENSVYNDSYVMENADGTIAENEDGDRLYAHEYKGLYNLLTGASENITLVTTSLDAPATEVINSITGVIRYDAENYEATLTTFGEVFVANGDYHYGGFAWLAAKDRISFAVQPKDENGDGDATDPGEKGTSFYANSDEDLVYKTLDSLKVTFIDLDAGADVDSDEHSFTDAYVFYKDDESNRKYYASVDLEDREQGTGYPAGTFPIKRHIISAKDISGNIGNGRITALTAGKEGLIASQGFFRWNGWCDYLIPPVNEDGDTVWTYEGSIRVKVTYYAYIDYDEDANTVDAVVVRVGEKAGVVGADASIPAVKDEPTDPEVNYTEE